MNNADIKSAMDLAEKMGINVAGDLVIKKDVQYEVNNVEPNGVGIMVTNKKDNTATSSTDDGPVADGTDLFRFIYPGIVDDGERLQVHKQVQNLLTHYGIQDICVHLKQMHDDRLVLLPVKGAQEMFLELQRMGMPDKEGFALKTFEKYYQR